MRTNRTTNYGKRNRLSYIPTSKLQEILSTDYCTTDIGTDYHPVKEELIAILNKRLDSQSIDHVNEVIDLFEAYEDFLDSEGVPPFPINPNFKANNRG